MSKVIRTGFVSVAGVVTLVHAAEVLPYAPSASRREAPPTVGLPEEVRLQATAQLSLPESGLSCSEGIAARPSLNSFRQLSIGPS